MAEQEQPRNVSDKEMQLIKATFTEELLKSIRALFMGLEVSEGDKLTIKQIFASDELMAVMERRFYPTLDKNTPIGQVQDAWLGAESMVFGNSPDTITQALQYKELALKYTRQSLDLLKDPNGKPVNLSYTPSSYPNDPLGINLLARNQFIRHVEQQLLFLWIIAQQKEVAPEVVEKKRKTNSTK